MKEIISEPYLSQIREFLSDRLGMHYSIQRESELSRKLLEAARKAGFSGTTSFIQWLLTSSPGRKDLEMLASFLTIGETYFLREEVAFEFLQEEFLKQYIYASRQTNRSLSVWSAGCSSGEEVYSLAGLIREMLPDHADWEIHITGTDINPTALAKAQGGKYSKWSFRKTPSWFMKYVEKIDENSYKICDCLKNMVRFQSHNLATESHLFYRLNIIFCRNVLIYFPPEMIRKITKGFYDSLAEGGVLVLSPVEASLDIYNRFMRKNFGGRTFFIKDGKTADQTIQSESPEKIAGADIEPPAKPEPLVVASESLEADSEYTHLLFLFKEGLYLRVENLIRQKAEELNELPVKYQELLGQTYVDQGKEAEAELLYKKIIESGNQDTSADYFLAMIYIGQKRFKEARLLLEEILRTEPGNILANYQLGLLEHRQGNNDKSQQYFTKALDMLREFENGQILGDIPEMTAGQLKDLISSVLREG